MKINCVAEGCTKSVEIPEQATVPVYRCASHTPTSIEAGFKPPKFQEHAHSKDILADAGTPEGTGHIPPQSIHGGDSPLTSWIPNNPENDYIEAIDESRKKEKNGKKNL